MLALIALNHFGCGDPMGLLADEDDLETVQPGAPLEQPFTSDVATLLDFDFDGELISGSGANLKGQIQSQLLYSVGHLNGEPGTARLDKLAITGATAFPLGNGLYRVGYHAHLPVAWGSKLHLPSSYTLTLPKRVDPAGIASFTRTYGPTCNDGEPKSVTLGNYWYHYRPKASGCSFQRSDVTITTAAVVVDGANRTQKYPEYHKLWEDGVLNVVAVFGKYAAGATEPSDAGIAAYNELYSDLRLELPDATITPIGPPLGTPTGGIPGASRPAAADISFSVQRANGRINVTLLLVDAVNEATPAWQRRYAELTPGADIVIYNGHAGLGANVAALSKMGKWFPGKYQIFMLNGCDTFAYYDNTLPALRAALNADDPTGSKYMDFITNAMPAYFSSMADDSMALIRAAAKPTHPVSYQAIFHDFDRLQVVVVTGEEDNLFTPTYDPGALWNGLEETGAVGKAETVSYTTELLQPGRYVFTTTPPPASSGGDADLRVRVGAAPTVTSTYKCPSYTANTNERCLLTLTSPSQIHIAVTGDAIGKRSPFVLRAWQLP